MRDANSRKNTFFVIYLFLLLIIPIQARSADVILAWNKNYEGNIAGYRVFTRLKNQNYNFNNPDWEGSETHCAINGLNDNTDYFFVVRAFSVAGNESRNSNEILYNSAFKPPIADAGPDQVGGKNETFFLNGLNSFDLDDSIVSYSWIQTEGTPVALSDSAKAKVKFTSPEILKDETLVFQLTVKDTAGNQSSDTCIVTITENNLQPSSEAGITQTVSPGVLVVLDGSKSFDPDDGILDYKWVQLAGIPVELSNPYDVMTSFNAPDIQGTGIALLFELQVTDRGGLFSTDTVVVNISEGGIPPTLETTSELEVFEGDTVILDTVWGVDLPGEALFYRWKQIKGTPVVFSETDSMAPSFVAPRVDNSEMVLGFIVSAENDAGLVDTTEIRVIVKQKGAFSFPDDSVPVTSAYGDLLGIKIEGDGSLTRIEAMLPGDVDDSGTIPESMIYGLFEIEIRAARPGDKVSVVFFLPEVVPTEYQWVKYNVDSGGWIDFSENVSFNSNRDQMVMALADGGTGDEDHAANRIITDLSGLALGAGYRESSGVSSDGSSGGCFIGTGIEKDSVNTLSVHEAFNRWSKKLSSFIHSFHISCH